MGDALDEGDAKPLAARCSILEMGGWPPLTFFGLKFDEREKEERMNRSRSAKSPRKWRKAEEE